MKKEKTDGRSVNKSFEILPSFHCLTVEYVPGRVLLMKHNKKNPKNSIEMELNAFYNKIQ